MNQTILVTGCAGFIGSNFCDLFASQYQIIGIDCFSRGAHRKNLTSPIRLCEADITSERDLTALFDKYPGIEGIINFAAESHVDHSLKDDGLFWSTNLLGVKNLACIALKKKIRFLQVSTDEVYGPSGDGVMFHEEDRLNPKNPYAASKAAADLLLMSYHESFGLDCIITRGSNTMGPKQSLEKAIPKAIYHFIIGKPFPLYRSPARRMWIGVKDHCKAVETAFRNGNSGQIYNVSPDSDHEIETSQLIDQIRSLIGKGEIKIVKDRSSYDLRYFISSSKIRTELDWRPEEEFASLLRETVRWYENNADWIETHPSRRFL